MIAALLLWAQTPALTFVAHDDVWVYPHASDPAGDAFMRIWGTQGDAVAPDPASAAEFSYGYLRFDVPAPAEGRRLVEARLEVTQDKNPPYTLDLAKASPLQARPLVGTFEEKTWTYGDSAKVYPGPLAYGEGAPAAVDAEKPTPIVIDLLKGPADFRTATANGGWVSLALTTTMDVATGNRTVYRLYTRDTETEAYRPRLVLRYE